MPGWMVRVVSHLHVLRLGNSPFQQHEEDLWVGRDVLHSGGACTNLTPYNVTKDVDHIFFTLEFKNRWFSPTASGLRECVSAMPLVTGQYMAYLYPTRTVPVPSSLPQIHTYLLVTPHIISMREQVQYSPQSQSFGGWQ